MILTTLQQPRNLADIVIICNQKEVEILRVTAAALQDREQLERQRRSPHTLDESQWPCKASASVSLKSACPIRHESTPAPAARLLIDERAALRPRGDGAPYDKLPRDAQRVDQ